MSRKFSEDATGRAFASARTAGDVVSDRDAERLERKIDGFAGRLPGWAARSVRWLTGPAGRRVRIPIALLLIVAGCLGFLPVLGFWMIPLGVLLLAQDVAFLRRPVLRLLTWLERKWARWKRRRS